jgi:hypothetical protein
VTIVAYSGATIAVRAGAKFENGKLVEGPDDTTATEKAA